MDARVKKSAQYEELQQLHGDPAPIIATPDINHNLVQNISPNKSDLLPSSDVVHVPAWVKEIKKSGCFDPFSSGALDGSRLSAHFSYSWLSFTEWWSQ